MTDERDMRWPFDCTSQPFSGRFGRLREVQLAVVPDMVDCEDVLAGAATGPEQP